MDTQTLIVFTLIVAAALYVGRSLWPSRRSQSRRSQSRRSQSRRSQTGCSSCPQNRNRVDDYT
jgi:hypothetical protein